MSYDQPGFTTDAAQRAMIKGLEDVIRSNLRERIVARIQPDIDEAVEAALSSMTTVIKSYMDGVNNRAVVNIILNGIPKGDKNDER